MICSLELLVQQGGRFRVQQLLHCGSLWCWLWSIRIISWVLLFGTACDSCMLGALRLSHSGVRKL